jgi:isocitrate/isopropylmalate dehydrogenase
MAQGGELDLPYRVEQWDDRDRYVEEVIALTGDYRIARVAFDEAVKRRPGRVITLRQKSRLLADSRKAPPDFKRPE